MLTPITKFAQYFMFTEETEGVCHVYIFNTEAEAIEKREKLNAN